MYIENGNFSLWCDFIEKDFLQNKFRQLIDENIINGATSNPTIFKNAFLNSSAYKEDIKKLKAKEGKEIYEALAIKDIQTSADLLKHLYERGDDGFISIEVDPALCYDAKGTIKEAKRLVKKINRENIMIKIPATDAGYIAMENLISENININATLVFSPIQAAKCLDAFEKGIKKLNNNLPKAVISVFVSRFDRKMDDLFLKKNIKGSLLGIMNANKIYHDIEDRGLKNIRTLFASTGVKNNNLVKDYYITNLLFENSINTAPIETIDAFVKTGIKEIRKPISKDIIDQFFNVVKNQGFEIEKIYDDLVDEGLKAFKNAFREMIKKLN